MGPLKYLIFSLERIENKGRSRKQRGDEEKKGSEKMGKAFTGENKTVGKREERISTDFSDVLAVYTVDGMEYGADT
ncbi:hypothetical protein SLEP1_g15681 [Rubroshorea leprosula]|uniref:Uncharacterized protein n=1 Tax=Rubroshorea leprosula TaxID=152421 RepID=A0AAV5ISE3_9ROSI|nr:hypothetical protein SLEP1_g15681 [Rubroshorea leprosula]